MAEKYINESPYCYVGNNPIIFIDPDGMAYRPTTDSTGAHTGFEWVDDSEAYDKDGKLIEGFFEKAILFTYSGIESTTIGSSTATVYDYVETVNEDGTVTRSAATPAIYKAQTSPSDPSAFGTVKRNVLLQVVNHIHNSQARGPYAALQLRTLDGLNVPAEGINPYSGLTTVSGANIHMAGGYNYTGTFNKLTGSETLFTANVQISQEGATFGSFDVKKPTYRYSGVSEACFLIDVTKWNSFMNHFPVGMGRVAVINK